MSPLSVLQAEHMTLDTKPSTLCDRTKNSASAINVIMFRNQGLHNIPYIYWHLKLGFSLAPQHLALCCALHKIKIRYIALASDHRCAICGMAGGTFYFRAFIHQIS